MELFGAVFSNLCGQNKNSNFSASALKSYIAYITVFPHIRPTGIIILQDLQLRVLLEYANPELLIIKIARFFKGVIKNKAINFIILLNELCTYLNDFSHIHVCFL